MKPIPAHYEFERGDVVTFAGSEYTVVSSYRDYTWLKNNRGYERKRLKGLKRKLKLVRDVNGKSVEEIERIQSLLRPTNANPAAVVRMIERLDGVM